MFRNEFVKFEDRLYIVKKTVKVEYNPNIDAWKEQTGSDVALRKGDLYYFCELIPEAEIVPFTSESCERV